MGDPKYTMIPFPLGDGEAPNHAESPPAELAFLSPRSQQLRTAYIAASVGDVDEPELDDRMTLQAIALETALLLFDDHYGTDGRLRSALTKKWVFFQPHFSERLADVVNAGRDRVARQLDAVLVLLHTFTSPDDDGLRAPLLEKLGAMGRPQDLGAILRHAFDGTDSDREWSLAALRALLKRAPAPATPRRRPRLRGPLLPELDVDAIVSRLEGELDDGERDGLRAHLTATTAR